MTHSVGIHDMALYVPSLYLDIKTLAKERNIEYDKLSKGLGLLKMSIPDVHEDTATMASNAVLELFEKNDLNPKEIERLYLGTESALDGSKPTATYILSMVENKLVAKYGPQCLADCDALDMTFACIGGVDALQNCVDWIRVNPGKKAIVVCSDFAKYELNSTGEYTQGAGAVAMLISSDPSLIEIENRWGVSTVNEHDFFKPIRRYKKKELLAEIMQIMDIDIDLDKLIDGLHEEDHVQGIFDSNSYAFHVHKETPVFDGQHSNACYQARVEEAYDRFVKARNDETGKFPLSEWTAIAFHLPYAFHAKRVFISVYLKELIRTGKWQQFCSENGLEISSPEELLNPSNVKLASKTDSYRGFVRDYMARGQKASSLIGNMYTGSIFQSLMSELQCRFDEDFEMANHSIGLIAYGSGSKAKIFTARVREGWKDKVKNFKIWEKLDAREELDYRTYLDLHMEKLEDSVHAPNAEFVHNPAHEDILDLSHIRGYEWQD